MEKGKGRVHGEEGFTSAQNAGACSSATVSANAWSTSAFRALGSQLMVLGYGLRLRVEG